ncbi:MAG: 1,4-dihydroxy-6-naphthoate synthase [Candidatus Eremiobacteraeota bacterium]|nr:1,4-dihydroxy-6-naphthoate synthase [Candidatus Eremiobacteraeota bacterium]
MDKPLTLAYSPCPNDTYIFAALTNGLLQDVPAVRVALEDVENLNSSAMRGDYELTKVSYGAIPVLMDKYRILRAGGAMGRGCGPLLVARPGTGKTLEDFSEKLIAIPGERTTAFMLLRLAMGVTPHIIQMRFDKIVEAVENGTVDAGLIIHESRFTYQEDGLVEIIDLGRWWESESGMPIPLGAILARNDLPDELVRGIDDAIRRSLQFARENENKIIGYVREHAVEMDDAVMRKHIDLYVNAFTDDVGDEGIAAVRELFKRAHAAGILPDPMEPTFV